MKRGQTGQRPQLFKNLLAVSRACGILVAQPGTDPRPQQWKHRILTTGPAGKSPRVLAFEDRLSGHLRRFLFCLMYLKGDAGEASTSEMPVGTGRNASGYRENLLFPHTPANFLIQGWPGKGSAEQHRKLLENTSSDISQESQNRPGPAPPPPCQQRLSKESRLPSLWASVSKTFPSTFLGEAPGHGELNWCKAYKFYLYLLISGD